MALGFSMKMPSVTSDGKRLAFLRSPHGYATSYVADLSVDGTRISNLRHFTLEESDAAIAGWSFDSKAVFIVKGHADHYEIYRGALDTDTEEVLVTSGGGGDVHADVGVMSGGGSGQVSPAGGSPVPPSPEPPPGDPLGIFSVTGRFRHESGLGLGTSQGFGFGNRIRCAAWL